MEVDPEGNANAMEHGHGDDLENANQNNKLCAVCKKPAEKSCAACKSVSYCSVEHQKADWKEHKNVCQKYKVNSSGGPYGEAYYEATKDIPKGTIIFHEPALLPFPKMPAGTFKKTDSLLCVTCGVNLSLMKTKRRCSICKWPICCDEHGKNKLHSENECKILASKNLRYDNLESKQNMRILRLVRAFAIKSQHPEKWAKIKSLIKPPFYYEDDYSIGNMNMKDVTNLQEDIQIANLAQDKEFHRDFEKILHLCRRKGFFNIGKGKEDEANPGAWSQQGVFVYEKASRYLPHSCAPNCDWLVGEYPDFPIQIRAGCDIKKGETLTASHLLQHNEQYEGTAVRRQHLRMQTNYLCQCKRCLDPTECQSFLSAITCTSCNQQLGKNSTRGGRPTLASKLLPTQNENSNLGYFLPTDDQYWGDYTDIYECNRCHKRKELGPFLHAINNLVDEINTYVNGRPGPVEGLRAIIMNNSGTFVHPNHWLIGAAVRNLLPFLRDVENLQHYRDLLTLAKYILQVDGKISNEGLSTARARFEYVFVATTIQLIHAKQENSSPEHPMQEQEFFRLRDFLLEAVDVYRRVLLYDDNVIWIAPHNRVNKPADLERTSHNINTLVDTFNSVIPVDQHGSRG